MDTTTVCPAAAAAAPQIAAVFEFVGAVVLGGEVSRTVAGFITSPGHFVDMPEVFAYGMLCATISAWMWVTTATYLELTVSTTHAISEWNNSAANCPYTPVTAACTNGSTWVGTPSATMYHVSHMPALSASESLTKQVADTHCASP